MNRLAYPQNKSSQYIIIAIAYVLYTVLFAMLRSSIGVVVGALALIPVIGASWYFGYKAGIFLSALSILNNMIQQGIGGGSLHELYLTPNEFIGFFVLTFVSLVVGGLKSVIQELSSALLKLEQYELDRQAHMDFLELLSENTGMALEADSLDSTLKILAEKMGKLFEADDSFITFWDETNKIPIPVVAYGSMSDIYSYIQFGPEDRAPTTSALEIGHPIAIVDLDTSPYIDPKIAAFFPSRSMLALPLIVHNRKLGALLLGYNKSRSFHENEINRAQVAAEQIALVLSKSLLLEEERKRVKQLTALHDISLISIEVDNEDELINRVTDVIGQNLFPDNFGILLLDEASGILKAHPSYRFFTAEDRHMMDVPLDKGLLRCR